MGYDGIDIDGDCEGWWFGMMMIVGQHNEEKMHGWRPVHGRSAWVDGMLCKHD